MRFIYFHETAAFLLTCGIDKSIRVAGKVQPVKLEMTCGISSGSIDIFLFGDGKHDLCFTNRLITEHRMHPPAYTLFLFFLHRRHGILSLQHGIQIITPPAVHHHPQVELVGLIDGLEIFIQPTIETLDVGGQQQLTP